MSKQLPEEKILVTGAGGRLGKTLTAALRHRYGPSAVIATDLRPEEPYNRGLNITDRTGLFTLVQTEKITTIYHLAGELITASERNAVKGWQTNVGGLLNVLDAAKIYGSRVFWPSSIAVFGPESPKENCPQDTILKPRTVYGMTKLAGEHWCSYYAQQYGTDIRSLRLPGIILPGATARGGLMDLIHEAPALALSGQQRYLCYLEPATRLSAIFIDEAIEAMLQLMAAPRTTIQTGLAYNVQGLSFSAAQLEMEIRARFPAFRMSYRPDERQHIAAQWPETVDESLARRQWHWSAQINLRALVSVMLGEKQS